MAKLNVPFYPASTKNYTVGRSGKSIKYFTVHHSAGLEDTLRHLWANPNRSGSSHFWVGNKPNQIEQYVDTNDTAWTNGNWTSNCESITCETRGDWRGWYDQVTLDNLSELMYQCLKIYPNLTLTYHQDVSNTFTECPADLKHKGYALQAWNKAKAKLKPAPNPSPQPEPVVKLRAVDIPNKTYVTNKDTDLWDLTFSKWSDAKSVKKYPKGSEIEISATVDHPLGSKYLLSEYSFSKGIMNGFNVADMTEKTEPKPEPIPEPEVPKPTEPETPPVSPPEPPTTPETPKPEPEPIPEPETPVEPYKPLFDRFIEALTRLIDTIADWFRK